MKLTGVYPHRDDLLKAINMLHEKSLSDLDVLMPVPDHEILEAVKHPRSGVGWISLAGGFFLGSLGLTGWFLWTHTQWSLITGGKPAVSLPPFVVVLFEMTVLMTGICTLLGVFHLCRLAPFKKDPDHDPRVSEDHYVLLVNAEAEQIKVVKQIFSETGAEVKS